MHDRQKWRGPRPRVMARPGRSKTACRDLLAHLPLAHPRTVHRISPAAHAYQGTSEPKRPMSTPTTGRSRMTVTRTMIRYSTSTRDYLDQIDRYKDHQGKPTESTRKPYDFFPAKCAHCGNAFKATSRNKLMVCSGLCRQAMLRLAAAPEPIPCAICGKKFKAIRGATVCSNNNCRNEARRRKRAAQ